MNKDKVCLYIQISGVSGLCFVSYSSELNPNSFHFDFQLMGITNSFLGVVAYTESWLGLPLAFLRILVGITTSCISLFGFLSVCSGNIDRLDKVIIQHFRNVQIRLNFFQNRKLLLFLIILEILGGITLRSVDDPVMMVFCFAAAVSDVIFFV